MNAKNAMLFWILFLISTLGAVAIATHLSATPLGLILFFLLFTIILTAIDVIIMGFLSMIFSTYRMKEISITYPLIRLDEDKITYRDENDEQITIPRSLISGIKKTDVMDKLEIISYLPNSAVDYWLWNIVSYEPIYNLLLRKGKE